MFAIHRCLLTAAAHILLALLTCVGHASWAADDTHRLALTFFRPLPDMMPGSEGDTPAQIALGQQPYFETALSANRSQSCNSCHNLRSGGAGVDHRPTSPGALGVQGRRNSPTTWNAGLQFAQFWDARVDTLEAQARSPLLNPDEMALASEAQALERLDDAGYRAQFSEAFPGEVEAFRFTNLLRALGAFQRTLISADRFDAYLRGDLSALSQLEKTGMTRFVQIGCNGCHSGALLGGDSVMKLGTAHRYPNEADQGRAEVTGDSAHRFFFKVPPLRNVGLTGPYFHDGSTATLEESVRATAWHQLSLRLSDEDVAAISAFLRTKNNTRELTF